MASNYDFRILINTIDGTELSYGSASLVSVQPNTSLVVNTDDMVDKINSMKLVQYFNGKTHTTASSLFDVKGFTTFTNTNIDGGSTDYQYLSASIKGNSDSGSILFHANNTPTAGGDYIKRYKFFGNKVCNVLGVPENYWIYVDKFRFTNTGSEQNYISGDVLAQSLHLRDNFAISNAGAIESDLPMKHAKDTDRWIKWTDVSSSIPQNDMLIGYSNQSDEYMIRMQNNKNLIISSSAVTASGNFIFQERVGIGTTSPDAKLEIDNTGTLTTTLLQLSDMDGTGNHTHIQFSNNGGSSLTMVGQINTVGDDLKINAADDLLLQDGGGKVGIGTTAPTALLEVRGDSQPLAMFSGSSYTIEFDHAGQEKFDLSHGTSGLYFRKSNVILAGVTQNHDFSVFNSSGNGYVNFDGSSGKVHIGSNLTSNPAATLDVRGDISASGNIQGSLGKFYRDGSFPQLQLSDDGGSDILNIGQSGGTGYFKTSDTNNDFRFRRSDNEDLMHLDMSALRVGINTTSPSKRLHINNSGILIDGGSSQETGDTATRFIIDSGTSTSHNLMDLRTDDGTILFVDGVTGEPGRVGIGTNAPEQTLDVVGNISSSGLVYQGQYPAFSATRNSAGSTTTDGAWTRLYFNVEDYDLGNDYNTTSAKFTVPIKGIYHLNASLHIDNTINPHTAGFRFSGSTGPNNNPYAVIYDMNEMYQADSTGDGHSFTITKDLLLEVGTEITVEYYFNDAGGSQNIDNSVTLDSDVNQVSWFEGHLVTPLP